MGTFREARLRLPDADTDLAYLAGIIDGEGSITRFLKAGVQLRWAVAVTNTDYGLMEYLLGIGGQLHSHGRASSLGKKECYRWQLQSAADVHRFLEAIEPYMKVKRAKACDVISEITGVLA